MNEDIKKACELFNETKVLCRKSREDGTEEKTSIHSPKAEEWFDRMCLASMMSQQAVMETLLDGNEFLTVAYVYSIEDN